MSEGCDIAILGAGTAGCLLAERLSRDPQRRVVVLERGPLPSWQLRIPGLGRHARQYLERDHTLPEPGLNGRSLSLTRAAVAGGGSSVNAMIYLRGRPTDYDRWNVPGWSFDEVLPFFKQTQDQSRGASHYHGVGGEWAVEDARSLSPQALAFVESWQHLGLNLNADFNGPDQTGVGFLQVTQRRGVRISAHSAFLAPAAGRPNVQVHLGSQVLRLILEGSRAVAVEYRRAGQTHRLEVAREVLVCLGALRSPVLLLRSGLGPADELRSHGIEVVLDLPQVGRNLQDHLGVPLLFPSPPAHARPWRRAIAPLHYAVSRRGDWASNGIPAAAFFGSSDVCEVECLLHDREIEGTLLETVLLDSESRGTIQLRPGDIWSAPLIRTGALSSPHDTARLERGLRRCLQLAEAGPLAARLGKLPRELDLRRHISATVSSCKHYAGTCAMGAPGASVVDAQLRVHGVAGLRVVDASVLPILPACHTCAPTLMVAERAAHFLRQAG